MNIWFISKYASLPLYGKAPSRLHYLAKEMKKLGNDCLLITSDANHFSSYPNTNKLYNYECQNDIDIIWIKTKKYFKTLSIDRVLSWLDFELKLFRMPLKKLNKPDVLIVSSLSIFTILYGYYLKKKFNTFLIFEIRDIWPLTLIEVGGFSKWHPFVLLIGYIEKFGYKNADLIVGTMPNLEVHVKQRINNYKPVFCSPLGFDPNSLIEEELFTNNPFYYLVNEDKVIIGYSGSLGLANGLDIFFETIKLMESNTNIHFIIVGSGDLENKFRNETSSLKNLTFLSRIEHKQVNNFLQICDILFVSTKQSRVWNYGQSMNKIVEYMLAAKPIIAIYDGFPSMINDANCGVFISKRDPEILKIEFLKFATLTKQDLHKIGENGRKWIIENRTYSKLANEYLNKINTLI
jgi:glycosyltransferase involved in cell wall biosynthesis